MTTTIALAGKGGVGKTTLAALLIKYLAQIESGSVLAIDADPSSNLNMVLGLDLEWTVGDIREDMLGQVKSSLAQGGAAMGSMPGGVSKRDYLDYQVHSALSEGSRYDLIAMGRGEGPGCYCAVNHNLRDVLDSISKHYPYVVIDNEAPLLQIMRNRSGIKTRGNDALKSSRQHVDMDWVQAEIPVRHPSHCHQESPHHEQGQPQPDHAPGEVVSRDADHGGQAPAVVARSGFPHRPARRPH